MSQKNSLEIHYYLLSLLGKKKLHFDIPSRCAVGRQMSGTLLDPLHRQKNSSKGCKSNRSPIYLESESVFVTCCILLLATTHRLRVARGDRSCFCSSWFRIIKIFAEWAPDSRDQPGCPLHMTRSFGLGVWEGYGQRHSTLECFSLYIFPI